MLNLKGLSILQIHRLIQNFFLTSQAFFKPVLFPFGYFLGLSCNVLQAVKSYENLEIRLMLDLDLKVIEISQDFLQVAWDRSLSY